MQTPPILTQTWAISTMAVSFHDLLSTQPILEYGTFAMFPSRISHSCGGVLSKRGAVPRVLCDLLLAQINSQLLSSLFIDREHVCCGSGVCKGRGRKSLVVELSSAQSIAPADRHSIGKKQA